METSRRAKIMKALQKFGPSMMAVIAIIPLGGLLMGIGVFMQNETFMQNMPFLASAPVFAFSTMLRAIGGLILGNLHILFAVAVAEGLSEHDGSAAFSAVVSFLTLNTVISSILGLTADSINGSTLYTSVLGIPTLQTGVFSGILVGLMVAWMYKKFKNVKLWQGLSFFQGKRLVPIMSVLGSVVLAAVLCVVWPPIQNAIIALGSTLGNTTNPFVLYIYGLVNRLLIPFGLHNLWYPIFYFQLGSWTNAAGNVIIGDLNIYLAQLSEGAKITHGLCSGGCYLFPGFCIGAAMAITNMAKPENRKKTFGLFAAGIVTIIFTGITEPIEFVFLFATPLLYTIHAFFMALSFPILAILNIHVGSTFCGGLMDWIVYGVLQNSPGWVWIIPLNIIVGFIYYYIFKFLIKKFDFKTPGREDVVEVVTENMDEDEIAAAILENLGGKDNIAELDACATRLRVTVNDMSGIDKESFKAYGASGVMTVGNNLQIIMGTQAAFLKEQIKAIMEGRTLNASEKASIVQAVNDLHEDIVAPMNGTIIPLTEIPDKVFAEGMMGTGFGINPAEGTVVSPVNGTIINVFPTLHAIGIRSDKGKEVMIHMGMDTVNMEGKPFEVYVKEGDIVAAGQKIAKMDIKMIEKAGHSTATAIVFTNMPSYEAVLDADGKVSEGQSVIHFNKK